METRGVTLWTILELTGCFKFVASRPEKVTER